MKKYVLVLSMLFLLQHAIAQSADEQLIKTLLTNQEAAWNKGSTEEFMRGYWKSDSLQFMGSNGPQYGWRTTLEHYKQKYPDTVAMGKLHFTILQMKPLSADYYFVTGKFHLTRSVGDLSGYFTLVFQKINGQWLIISDHTS